MRSSFSTEMITFEAKYPKSAANINFFANEMIPSLQRCSIFTPPFADRSLNARSYVYKGHVIRDTFLRLVTFRKKIRDRLILDINFMA